MVFRQYLWLLSHHEALQLFVVATNHAVAKDDIATTDSMGQTSWQ
jgi:hypothetical protein